MGSGPYTIVTNSTTVASLCSSCLIEIGGAANVNAFYGNQGGNIGSGVTNSVISGRDSCGNFVMFNNSQDCGTAWSINQTCTGPPGSGGTTHGGKQSLCDHGGQPLQQSGHALDGSGMDADCGNRRGHDPDTVALYLPPGFGHLSWSIALHGGYGRIHRFLCVGALHDLQHQRDRVGSILQPSHPGGERHYLRREL
jgi:hypothetical protein